MNNFFIQFFGLLPLITLIYPMNDDGGFVCNEHTEEIHRNKYYYCESLSGLKENTEIKLNGLIYPVPDSRFPFLGIHSVKLINGDVYFGPNSIPALGRENYRGIKGISWRDSIKNSYILLKKYLENNEGFRTFSHRESLQFFKYAFYMHIKKMLPKIKYTDIAASNKVGIRAQLINKHTNNFEMDFIVERNDNTIHVLNTVSPAFTSSFAFAPYILNSK